MKFANSMTAMNYLIDHPILINISGRLATTRGGRIALHLACMLAGSDRRPHWRGICRELAGR
ncbi:hypothetical protein [Variovorax sp. HW608]|uniref:hypothetical protein n=1 Tax=Variovorax sp. HW608 TaxID=1034889 RepID=UPI0012FE5102|nr:hypothetical protein [Variovorax sp. HW608]